MGLAPPGEAFQPVPGDAVPGGEFLALGREAAPRRAVLHPPRGQGHGQGRHVPAGVVLRVLHAGPLSAREDQVAQAQARGHGLGEPGEVDHPLRGQGRQGGGGVLAEHPVDVLLDDQGVPLAGDGHQGAPPLQAHGGGGGVVERGGEYRQADPGPARGLEGAGEDAVGVHGQGVEPALPVAGRGLEAGVDQAFAGQLLGVWEQGDGRVHGVLGPGADQEVLGRGLHGAPFHPAGDGVQVRQRVPGPGVVQEARGGALVKAPQGRGQVRVARGHRRDVGREVDDAAKGLLLQGEQGGFGGHAQHVGAPAHFAPQVAPAGGLAVGAAGGAHVHTQEIGQEAVGGELVPGPELAQADGVADGVGDGEVGGLVRIGKVRNPHCHAHNHATRAHKMEPGG